MLGRCLRRMFPTRVSFHDESYIEFLNREAIIYSEKDGRRMEIIWYFQRGCIRGRVLNIRDIDHWDSPHEKEILPLGKRKEIEQKVIEYCRRRKIPLKIEREKKVFEDGMLDSNSSE